MYRIIISFLFIVFLTNSVKGQTLLSTNTTTSLTLSSDYLNADMWESLNLIITNSQNVTISGIFYSNSSIAIVPTGNKSILIKPGNLLNKGDGSTGTGTTVVKPVAGGAGSMPLVTLYPNPVYSDLTFSVTEKPVVAYSIYDINGNFKMAQTISPTNTHTINVNTLTPANYLLKLDFADNSYITVQFIKN